MWVGDPNKNIKDVRTYVGERDDRKDAEFLAALFMCYTGPSHHNWFITTEIVEETVWLLQKFLYICIKDIYYAEKKACKQGPYGSEDRR